MDFEALALRVQRPLGRIQQFRRQNGQIGAFEQHGSERDQAALCNRTCVESRP